MMRYLIPVVLFLCISCESNSVYQDYVNLDDAFWHADSIKTFQFMIEDTTVSYDLYATFRNASSYPFYNLYYQYTLADSLDNPLEEELKEIELFNPKTGEPYGSGLGDMFDHSILLNEGYRFQDAGSYSIKLQQFMRMDTLPFILSVGVKVELRLADQ